MPATVPLVLDESGDVGEPFRGHVERESAPHFANGTFVGKQQTPREREVRVTLICGDRQKVTDDRVRHMRSTGSGLVDFLRKITAANRWMEHIAASGRGLEQLDRIAVGVFDLDLPAPGPAALSHLN